MARHSQRFLLNIFPSTQEIRRPQTSYKSASSQQVSQETTLQNGFFKHSVESSSTGRLGHKSRLDRCLHAHTHSQGSQEISKVLYSGQGVPIHLPLFRPSSGPQGVHKGGVCSSGTPQNSKFTSSCLPRRLVPSESDKKVIICRQKDCTQSPCRFRFHDKLKKISIGTKSVGNLYWGTFPISKRGSLSNSRESAQNKRSMHEVKDSTYSSELPSFVRANGFLHRTGSKRKAFHETNTIASPTFLETSKNGHSNSGTIQYSDTKASAILVERRKSTEGKELLCLTLFKNNHNRCIKTGLRRSHGKPTVSGNLVHAGVQNAHKLARTESSLSDSQTFSSPAKGLYCVNTLRQHNSSSVYCKGRGDSFSSPVLSNMGHLTFSKDQQHNTQISSCCRSPERICRQIKQGENTCKTLGMVTTQYSSPQAFSDLGDASNRLVCIGSKQENASVLHMVPQSIGTGNRCIVNCLGEHGSLCLSTNLSGSKSTSTHEEISVPDNFDSSPVATEKLVHRSPSNVNSLPKETASKAGSVVSAQSQNISPKSATIQSNSMVSVNRSFQDKGFSEDSRKLMVASWRPGTRKDYSVKFKQFSGWCSERKIDPYTATLTNCADFLSSLFQKGLKYRTISGYRSMLSVMLPKIDGTPIGQHTDITRLLKGVFNSRPPVKRLVPEWDLKKVLELLSYPPFEPIHKISLKC